MSELVVFENISLDGVMQAPGRPDEDIRNGFTQGGWAVPYAAMQEASDSMGSFGALLLGRRTYEDFYGFWFKQTNNPFTDMLNQMQKYVLSTTLEDPLPWVNSTLLQGDVAAAVNQLKAELDSNLLVMGSGNLIQTLVQHNLIDRYILLIHPLLLGTGRKLFPDSDIPTALELVSTQTTSKGVIVATYHPLTKA